MREDILRYFQRFALLVDFKNSLSDLSKHFTHRTVAEAQTLKVLLCVEIQHQNIWLICQGLGIREIHRNLLEL